ncbi:three component ABC system middle component [Mycolicibacterium anyangense]|uniref:three component ABC system middle component n=1 Tax=Mycolicibacterium anyangense TaxID=1431246 RepID=UPI00389963EE
MASRLRRSDIRLTPTRSVVTTWTDRSPVVAAYLNPAFTAAVISEAAAGHQRDHVPMIWPLSYLVLPFVLHRPTREALPGNTRTHLSTWVRREPVLRAGFPYRAASLAQMTSEGLRFGVRHSMFRLHDGNILSGNITNNDVDPTLTQLLAAARLVGRWIAKSKEPSTVFALLGVGV